uniref:Uncharacterized protein n=1 Tax=Chlorobium chlorochromatii (strain CaD3) TaxID=340177 RepID=Q3ATG8_CHLCH
MEIVCSKWLSDFIYIMTEYLYPFQEFLKIVPGLLIFPISLYLGLQKIGTKVNARISFSSNPTSPSTVRYIDLRNMKERTIVIYSIFASVNDEEILLELKQCNPPIILKAHQSTIVEIPTYSFMQLDGSRLDVSKLPLKKTTIYLELAHTTIKCHTLNYQKSVSRKLSKYQILEKEDHYPDALPYNKHAIYAITYSKNSRIKTATINEAGTFHGDWTFSLNQLPISALISKESVESYLQSMNFSNEVEWFKVYYLNHCSS